MILDKGLLVTRNPYEKKRILFDRKGYLNKYKGVSSWCNG